MNQIDKPEEFEKLSPDEKKKIIEWISENIKPRKTINKWNSSYGLKHIFEDDKASGGFYMTNGQFKGAMLKCGFKPVDERELNWMYCISQKSPAFKKRYK